MTSTFSSLNCIITSFTSGLPVTFRNRLNDNRERPVTLDRQLTSRNRLVFGVQRVGSSLYCLCEETTIRIATTDRQKQYPQGLPRGGGEDEGPNRTD